jgi:hypothetical protein
MHDRESPQDPLNARAEKVFALANDYLHAMLGGDQALKDQAAKAWMEVAEIPKWMDYPIEHHRLPAPDTTPSETETKPPNGETKSPKSETSGAKSETTGPGQQANLPGFPA